MTVKLKYKLRICGLLLIMIGFFCFAGPYLSPYGEYQIFYTNDGGMALVKASPSWAHFLGTDKNGQDIFTRLMYGGRLSLMVALCVVTAQVIFGSAVGLVSGYFGKKVDMILMRIVDVINSLPDMIIILILSAISVTYGVAGREKIALLILFLSFFSWTYLAKLVRGQTLYLKEMEYVKVAELCGVSVTGRLINHILPGIMREIIAIIPISIGSVILIEASISFLGFGLPYPYASWGNMLSAAMDLSVLKNNLNIWLPPGVLLMITVGAFNLFGEAVKEWSEER